MTRTATMKTAAGAVIGLVASATLTLVSLAGPAHAGDAGVPTGTLTSSPSGSMNTDNMGWQ